MKSDVSLPPNVIDRDSQAKLSNGRAKTLAFSQCNHEIHTALPWFRRVLQSTFGQESLPYRFGKDAMEEEVIMGLQVSIT